MRLARNLLLLTTLVLAADAALARPGGGHSFSGGGHGGGGGGGGFSHSGGGFSGGAGTAVHGGSGIGLLAFVILIVIVVLVLERPATGWDSDGARPAYAARATARPPSLALRDLRRRDPDFSRVLFDDFAYALFAAGHLAAAKPEELARLVPYLGPVARGYLQERARAWGAPQAVVIGAMRPTSVTVPPPPARPGQLVDVELEFEANVAVEQGGAAATRYLLERWTLSRAADARTRPWSAARAFACPSCGAPFQATADARCASCGQVVDNGRFDWVAQRIELLRSDVRPPSLTGTVEERGTDLPTVIDPELAAAWAELVRDESSLASPAGLDARLRLVFGVLQESWRAQDLAKVRPFVSDGMSDYLRYWIEAYRRQGLRNVVDGAALVRWVAAKVVRDKHYDALTVRLWGTGRDYTVETATGQVVGGDPARERPYSEYWTLIRGASVRGAPRADRACPACGAELTVNMGGNCEYCGVHVTAGEFDWVLGRIEQDDVYEG